MRKTVFFVGSLVTVSVLLIPLSTSVVVEVVVLTIVGTVLT